MVTMEELVCFTLAHELVPKVVAGLKQMTIGGAISGASLNSSSHKHGQFMDTVVWIQAQISGPDGEPMIKTTYRGDSLWCTLSSTLGCFGIVLEAAVECVVASPFVQVAYYSFSSLETVIAAMLQHVHLDQDGVFLEALDLFRRSNKREKSVAVLCKGHMIGKYGDPDYTDGWKCRKLLGGKFYWEHVRDLVQHHNEEATTMTIGEDEKQPAWNAHLPFFVETLELKEYLFRSDYGASYAMARPMTFPWSKIIWAIFGFVCVLSFPWFNKTLRTSYFLPPLLLGFFFWASYRWVRVWTGFLMTTERLYRLLNLSHQELTAKKYVVQDLYLPQEEAVDLVNWARDSIPSLSVPIWMCPVRTNNNQAFSPSYHESAPLLIDCAIRGRVSDNRGVDYTRQLETRCQQGGGRKLLNAQSHYDRQLFWQIYDKNIYDLLRHKFHASQAFPDFFEKACPAVLRSRTIPGKISSFLSFCRARETTKNEVARHGLH
jgi:delta24-sterol reductase